MIDVTALGELLIDFTAQGSDTDGYPTMAAHPGGAPANFLAAVSKMGGKTALLGKVGDDAFGQLLTRSLQKAEIDTGGLLRDDGVFTTLAFVTLGAAGRREFSFARKPGADTQLRFDELKLSLIDECRAFHFGTLSLTDEPAKTATVRAVEYAKARGKLISFDPNLRPPLWKSRSDADEQIRWGLQQADLVKLSDDEAAFLFNTDPEDAAERIVRQYGAALVFVTCGEGGCVYHSAAAKGSVPALSGIRAADTTGAGDIFGGCALWALLRQDKPLGQLTAGELEAVASFACTAAGLSVTRPGGMSSVPDKHEVLTVMGERGLPVPEKL